MIGLVAGAWTRIASRSCRGSVEVDSSLPELGWPIRGPHKKAVSFLIRRPGLYNQSNMT